jgi:tetratricopeptide (TPR) repeat protein
VAGTQDRTVERARTAHAHQDWAEVYRSLSALELSTVEDAHTLEALADAAWWLGKLDECIAAREGAYARFEAEGDARRAARSAILLYDYYCFKGRRAVANGWLQRAKRLLEDVRESPEHGVLLEREAEVANGSGALELALAKAGSAIEVGRRLGDADVEADALQCKGRLLITLGKDNAANTEWVRNHWSAIHPYSGTDGGYVNFMGSDDQGRVEANYGANYERLARIKATYDPDNVFHLNQNIEPRR